MRCENRTLLVSKAGLEQAKGLITSYKQGTIKSMNPELWQAKKIVDSTLHPGALGRKLARTNRSTIADVRVDTGEPVVLPFRMSSFVLSNLIVTAGMLTPGLQVRPFFQDCNSSS